MNREIDIEIEKNLSRYKIHNPNFSLDKWQTKWQSFAQAVHNGYRFGIYDYTNDLSSRDKLQDFINSLPTETKLAIEKRLEKSDQLFKDSTNEVNLVLPGTSEKMSYWWWKRAPKVLNDELEDDFKAFK